MPRPSFVQAVKASFSESIGDIVFGMEDGTVSIFGLVFGVAASASNSQTVLLAGATGAAAAAVSMMAGTYLDVETARGQARAQLAQKRAEIAHEPEKEAKAVDARLQGAGFTAQERGVIITALRRMPDTWLRLESDVMELGPLEKRNPLVQSLWMFAADLLAAAIPVIPFALLSLGPARSTSVTITGLLLVLLGVGRAKVARTNLLLTIFETVGVATAAAVAGFLIGKLVTR
ncbi:MAG TPA: VIT1/CCC1 transporter family protein [bacterium]|nr:VIT1/CCC1 transporter family protein [bacterium]